MALIVHHLSGPLAGQEQRFEGSTGGILVGRGTGADLSYPLEFAVVSRRHAVLVPTRGSEYKVELLGENYVEVDGVEADPETRVKDGSTVRLAGSDGPSFRIQIDREAVDGPTTRPQKPRTTWRKRFAAHRRQTLVALAVLAGAIVILAGIDLYQYQRERQFFDTAQAFLDEQRANARASFESPETLELIRQLREASYLVLVRDINRMETPVGTAWAVRPNMVATNAHVIRQIGELMGPGRTVILRGPGAVAEDGSGFRDVVVDFAGDRAGDHPGYEQFKAFVRDYGVARPGLRFQHLDLVSVYDVGVLNTATPLDSWLEIARDEHLWQLDAGRTVAFAGYPIQGSIGRAHRVAQMEPDVHIGNITSMNDVFMRSGSSPERRLLVRHNLPAHGGASGSPIIDSTGKVVALLNAVTMVSVDGQRTPSAALINFGQRADLLRALIDGGVEEALAGERDYWQSQSAHFLHFFDVAEEDLKLAGEGRYFDKPDVEPVLDAGGSLERGLGMISRGLTVASHPVPAEPGMAYGFVAYAEQGAGVSLRIERDGEVVELQEGLAPMAFVTTSGGETLRVIVSPVGDNALSYRIRGYRWRLSATAAASSS